MRGALVEIFLYGDGSFSTQDIGDGGSGWDNGVNHGSWDGNCNN